MSAAWPPQWMPAEPVGSECSGREQPGTRVLLETLTDAFSASSLGIYNCRQSTGGAGLSVHAEGRALDLRPDDWSADYASAIGNNVLVALGENAEALGIQRVIWWEHIYDEDSPLGRPYRGSSPHHDHLHIEQTWDAARTLDRARAEALLLPPHDPSPEDGMLLLRRHEVLADSMRWLYVDGRRFRLQSWDLGVQPLLDAGVPTVALLDSQLAKITEV